MIGILSFIFGFLSCIFISVLFKEEEAQCIDSCPGFACDLECECWCHK